MEAITQLDTDQPAVKLKLDLLEAAMPVSRAVVYGDMWEVEGAYSLRCLELGWLCAAGRNLEEALARLRDLVEVELSHRAGPWPLRAIVVPLDVPALQARQ